MIAILDTNILVSGLWKMDAASPPVRILHAFQAGEIDLAYNSKILKEYYEVLTRKNFGFSPKKVQALVGTIESDGLKLPWPYRSDIPTIVGKGDEPFYAALKSCELPNTFLVTGNLKHFPQDPDIISPREFVDNFFMHD